jgi:hypothetical protein
MKEEKEDIRIKRHIMLLFAIFCVVTLAAGIIAYNFAAVELKKQLVNKCHALAATIAAVIAEDSDGYAAFLKDMDVNSAYYKRMHDLMIKIRQDNNDHITYLYTQKFINDDTFAFVLDGEPMDSPLYTPPGVQEQMTWMDIFAFREQKAVLGRLINPSRSLALAYQVGSIEGYPQALHLKQTQRYYHLCIFVYICK